MAQQCSSVDSMNFLNPTNFRFVLNRAPGVTYTVQSITLPSMSLPSAPAFTPFTKLPNPGDHIDFMPMSMIYKVNENMDNWFEIYNWMTALGSPRNFEEYSSEDSEPDGTLLILDSNNNVSTEVYFYNMYPMELGPIQFNVQAAEVEYAEGQVEFIYSTYKAVKV